MIRWLTEHVKGSTALQPLFERLQRVSLIGMNYGRGGGFSTSGELWLLHSLAQRRSPGKRFVIFDVGANRGEYTRAALDAFGDVSVHAFEPQASAYASLEREFGRDPRVTLCNAALGADEGSVHLYSPGPASTLASVHRRTVADWDPPEIAEALVPMRTLAGYCADAGVDRIDLLKIDVEGHELSVLQGAMPLLDAGRIASIQWEFGATHVVARTFLRDFFDLLGPRYRIHRLLRNGLREVSYSTFAEVFFVANFYAETRGRE